MNICKLLGSGLTSCLTKRALVKLLSACCICVWGVWAVTASAQSNLDDRFERFVGDQACPSTDEQSAAFSQFCTDIVTPAMATLGEGGFISMSRLGAAGVLGHSAEFAVASRKEQVAQRFRIMQGRGRSQSSGGQASVDLGLDWLGLYASTQFASSERDTTARESGYESDLFGGLVGVDIKWTSYLVTGLAFGASKDDADLDNAGGKVETEGRSASFYIAVAPSDTSYIGAYAAFTRFWFDTQRNIQFGTLSEQAIGDALGQQLIIGLSGGYDYVRGPWALGAYANIDWTKSEIEQYSERGATLGLQFNDQNVFSITSTLGLRGTYAQAMSWGTLTPELRLAWVREYDNGSRTIETQLVQNPGPVFSTTTDDPDRNYFQFGAGVTADLRQDVSLFVDYNRQFGHRHLSGGLLNAGVLVEF